MVIAVEPLRIAYAAVPKAACSTVKSLIARIDPEGDGAEELSLTDLHRRYRTRRFRPYRLSRDAGWFRFTVVRDPTERLMSLYTSRVRDWRDLERHRRIGRRLGGLPVAPDPDTFFRYLDAYALACSSIRHHALPARLFTGPDLGVYDRVYRVEDLQALEGDLTSRTTAPVRVGHHNRSTESVRLSDLGRRTVAAIRPRLDAEYAFLNRYYAAAA